MNDPTEAIRRTLINEQRINGPYTREELEAKYGQVWDTKEATEEFEFIGFLAPFATVRRRSDGKEGTLMFQHHERFYYGFI